MAKQSPKRAKTLDVRISPWMEYGNKDINEILDEKKSSVRSEQNENSKSAGATTIRRKSILSSIEIGRSKKSTESKSQDPQSLSQQLSLTRSEARNEINHSTEVNCISCFGKF